MILLAISVKSMLLILVLLLMLVTVLISILICIGIVSAEHIGKEGDIDMQPQ